MYDSRNPTWKRYHWFIDLNFLNSIFLWGFSIKYRNLKKIRLFWLDSCISITLILNLLMLISKEALWMWVAVEVDQLVWKFINVNNQSESTVSKSKCLSVATLELPPQLRHFRSSKLLSEYPLSSLVTVTGLIHFTLFIYCCQDSSWLQWRMKVHCLSSINNSIPRIFSTFPMTWSAFRVWCSILTWSSWPSEVGMLSAEEGNKVLILRMPKRLSCIEGSLTRIKTGFFHE
jgi:hypothetical protein